MKLSKLVKTELNNKEISKDFYNFFKTQPCGNIFSDYNFTKFINDKEKIFGEKIYKGLTIGEFIDKKFRKEICSMSLKAFTKCDNIYIAKRKTLLELLKKLGLNLTENNSTKYIMRKFLKKLGVKKGKLRESIKNMVDTAETNKTDKEAKASMKAKADHKDKSHHKQLSPTKQNDKPARKVKKSGKTAKSSSRPSTNNPKKEAAETVSKAVKKSSGIAVDDKTIAKKVDELNTENKKKEPEPEHKVAKEKKLEDSSILDTGEEKATKPEETKKADEPESSESPQSPDEEPETPQSPESSAKEPEAPEKPETKAKEHEVEKKHDSHKSKNEKKEKTAENKVNKSSKSSSNNTSNNIVHSSSSITNTNIVNNSSSSSVLNSSTININTLKRQSKIP